MKAAIIVVVLAPTLALGQEVPTATPTAASAQTPAPATEPATEPAASPAASPAATASAATASASGALAALEEKENQGGFSLGVELDHAVGTGTFVDPSLYSYFGATLSVVPRYVAVAGDLKLAVSLVLRAAWEYTLPDSENGRRLAPDNTRLALSIPGLYKNGLTGISLAPSLVVLIPTTPEAWQAGLITNLSLGIALARPIGRFNLGLTVSGSRGFYLTGASQVASQKASGASDQLNSFAARKSALGNDESAVGFFGWNTAWGFNVGGTVSLQATDELSFIVGYTYSHAWKYYGVPIGLDETLPANAKYGAGEGEKTSAVIAANYQLTDHYGVSLSASTLQTPRSGANGAAGYFRFPFWAIGNAAENATSISFTFSAGY